MTASTEELVRLKDRISNLELALHGMWALLRDLQPPATQHDINNLLAEHFDRSREAGGFAGTGFVG